jgi:hypothetical protein
VEWPAWRTEIAAFARSRQDLLVSIVQRPSDAVKVALERQRAELKAATKTAKKTLFTDADPYTQKLGHALCDALHAQCLQSIPETPYEMAMSLGEAAGKTLEGANDAIAAARKKTAEDNQAITDAFQEHLRTEYKQGRVSKDDIAAACKTTAATSGAVVQVLPTRNRRVAIVGLKNATFNGQTGTIRANPATEQRGRIRVELDQKTAGVAYVNVHTANLLDEHSAELLQEEQCL